MAWLPAVMGWMVVRMRPSHKVQCVTALLALRLEDCFGRVLGLNLPHTLCRLLLLDTLSLGRAAHGAVSWHAGVRIWRCDCPICCRGDARAITRFYTTIQSALVCITQSAYHAHAGTSWIESRPSDPSDRIGLTASRSSKSSSVRRSAQNSQSLYYLGDSRRLPDNHNGRKEASRACIVYSPIVLYIRYRLEYNRGIANCIVKKTLKAVRLSGFSHPPRQPRPDPGPDWPGPHRDWPGPGVVVTGFKTDPRTPCRTPLVEPQH